MSTTSPAGLPLDAAAALSASPQDAAPLTGLDSLGHHLASLGTLDVSAIDGCNGEAMLVLEGADLTGQPATWLVTAAPGRPMVLEAVIEETRLELLAIAPADRILALLGALAGRVRVDA